MSKNMDFEKNLESIRSFDDFVKHLEYNEAYNILLDKDVFGEKIVVPLQRVDMEYISEMKEISVACIMLYISHLYHVIKSSNFERRFLFVNPFAISGTNKFGGSSKSSMLASSLKDANNEQLVFVPYNLGYHWILVVIDLSSPTAYYLDSVDGEIHPNLKIIFNAALKIYDSTKRNTRRSLVWKQVQCPQQPTNVECGFYAMRYMRDLIKDESILRKRDLNGKKTYTTAEIDEVRVEWINLVLEHNL